MKLVDRINAMDLEIEEMCLKLLALRQAMAIDLRFITAAMKINTDLERMGDHATNIAEDVIFMVDARVVKHHAEEKEKKNNPIEK